MSPGKDPLPLSGRQVAALAAAAARELTWVLPAIGREADRWSRLAVCIPDEPLRADAMVAYASKRGNLAGATLFATLPNRRSGELLRALVAFQTIFDFLDDAHERHPTAENSHLFRALIDAVTPGTPVAEDYYERHPWKDDGGYLRALVTACRHNCEALPSFALVEPLLAREAERSHRALALNHLDPEDRDDSLRRWAEAEFPNQRERHWFELTAAASGALSLFVLLALAAKPDLDEWELTATYDAYWPLVPLITTMLDSFVDQAEDDENGAHNYVSHYGDRSAAVQHLSALIEIAAERVVKLPDGHRHAVIFACMVTFYLAKDSALTVEVKPQAKRLIGAGGSLPRALAPVLRAWRTAYAQRAA